MKKPLRSSQQMIDEEMGNLAPVMHHQKRRALFKQLAANLEGKHTTEQESLTSPQQTISSKGREYADDDTVSGDNQGYHTMHNKMSIVAAITLLHEKKRGIEQDLKACPQFLTEGMQPTGDVMELLVPLIDVFNKAVTKKEFSYAKMFQLWLIQLEEGIENAEFSYQELTEKEIKKSLLLLYSWRKDYPILTKELHKVMKKILALINQQLEDFLEELVDLEKEELGIS